ncbi:papain family cysteine protease [Trichuris suis]|nr:papain family cysteine protease [Trichuris suis]
MYLRLFLLAFCWTAKAAFYEDHYAKIKKAFEREANGPKPSWTLGMNDRFRGMSLADMKLLLGVPLDKLEPLNFTMETTDYSLNDTLPEELDARTKWPECAELISIIKDQSNCGSCWAVSAASVMSDRTCIGSNGTTVKFLSDEELLSCCKKCGYGCNGGNPQMALLYWKTIGVPTGGLYGSKKGCKPYSFPPNNKKKAITPACVNKCIKEYPIDLAKDRNKALRVYGIRAGEMNIMRQINQYGPVVAAFYVYVDFFYYKSGIYEHKKGNRVGAHAVRIIGWGKQGKEKYWLVANSWGKRWGEKANMLLRLILLTLWCRIDGSFYEDHYVEIQKTFKVEQNGQKPSWTLGINDYFRGMSLADMKALMGAQIDHVESFNFTTDTIGDRIEMKLPEEFDARKQWPECASLISIIKQQAKCGSCWAIATSSVMSDRTCIATKGRIKRFLSDQELLTCCKYCGNGCNGGSIHNALFYWKKTGVPTGGLYGSKSGCKPYTIPPNKKTRSRTPRCTPKCIKEYPVDLSRDRYKGNSAYTIRANEVSMMNQIYYYGPIVAIMQVYSDLAYYKSGIYEHKTGTKLSAHAIRIIGWGKQGDDKYWLVANSWGTDWGEDGFFKIKRGQNECAIEEYPAAGDPMVRNTLPSLSWCAQKLPILSMEEKELSNRVVRYLNALGTFDHPAIAFLFVQQQDRISALKHATYQTLYSLIYILICQIHMLEPEQSAAFWPIVSRKEEVQFNSFYRQWFRTVRKYLPESLNSFLEPWPSISSVKGCFEALERLSVLAMPDRLAKQHHTIGAFGQTSLFETNWESLTAQEIDMRERQRLYLKELTSEQVLAKQELQKEKEQLEAAIKEKQDQLRKLMGCNASDTNEALTLKAEKFVQGYKDLCDELCHLLSPLERLEQRLSYCLAVFQQDEEESDDEKTETSEEVLPETINKATLEDGSVDVFKLCEEVKLKMASINVAEDGDVLKRVLEGLQACESVLLLQREKLVAIKNSLMRKEEKLKLSERSLEKDKIKAIPPDLVSHSANDNNTMKQMLHCFSAEHDSAEPERRNNENCDSSC